MRLNFFLFTIIDVNFIQTEKNLSVKLIHIRKDYCYWIDYKYPLWLKWLQEIYITKHNNNGMCYIRYLN